jgi:hypothetical protein
MDIISGYTLLNPNFNATTGITPAEAKQASTEHIPEVHDWYTQCDSAFGCCVTGLAYYCDEFKNGAHQEFVYTID